MPGASKCGRYPRERQPRAAFGRALEPVVRAAIARVRPLLALPTYQQFATLTPVGVDEDIWTLRASLLDAPAELTSEQQMALVRVGLTLTRSELADGEFLARATSLKDGGPLEDVEIALRNGSSTARTTASFSVAGLRSMTSD